MKKYRPNILYDEIFIPEFGTRLLEAINIKGMTQKELSLKLCLEQSAVNGYITGRRYPSIPVLVKMCQILNVSADYLLELK